MSCEGGSANCQIKIPVMRRNALPYTTFCIHCEREMEKCPDWLDRGGAGNWKEAVATLEKSMDLRKGGDSSDWFFLAMAHWQLGEKDKARKWFDQAAEWMDKNQPKNGELRRFRAEAAELMGIEGAKK